MTQRRRLSILLAWIAPAVFVAGLTWAAYSARSQARLNAELLNAIKRLDAVRVEALLSQGANPNSREGAATRISLVDIMLAASHLGPKKTKGNPAIILATENYTAFAYDLVVKHKPEAQRKYSAHHAIVRALIDAGADVNARNDRQETALVRCGLWDDTPVARLLLQHGANLFARDGEGYDCWDLATTYSLQKLLLEHGAHVDQPDPTFREPQLAAAVRNGYTDQVNLLLAHGADPNARDPDGYTALMVAADSEWCTPEIATTLLAHGGDPTIRNNDGQTPLQRAISEGNTRLIPILRRALSTHNATATCATAAPSCATRIGTIARISLK